MNSGFVGSTGGIRLLLISTELLSSLCALFFPFLAKARLCVALADDIRALLLRVIMFLEPRNIRYANY